MSKKQSTVMEEAEYIIVGEMTHKDSRHLGKLLIFIIILIFTLSFLHFNKAQSYSKYERVQFESSGATLYANLYYPSKSIAFQEKKPLIIYCHGMGSKRDFDLRIPIELSKRGFFLASLDYQGHGESGGNINNIDPTTGIPALAQDCSKLLDKLETMPFYKQVNTTQIGLIGHSLGGMVVLMNQALDPRFKVTVAWAPLVNFIPPLVGFVYNENFVKYIPVNLLNEENTDNLLIIHHIHDELLDFTDQALKAQELTNCTVIPITEPLIGGNHQLFSDEVLKMSINWFELHFFGSISINGSIFITFYLNYILIIINLILICITVISLASVSSRLFFRNKGKQERSDLTYYIVLENNPNKKKQVAKIIAYIGTFLLNLLFFKRIFGLIGIIYGSLTIILIYTIAKFTLYFRKIINKRQRNKFSEIIKIQFNLKYVVFTIMCVGYLIGIYMLFSFYYPFAFIWPSNFVIHFALGYLAFPIFLSVEILLRKVIYPNLKYCKSEGSKNRVIIITAAIIVISLMLLTQRLSWFPSVLFMYLLFLMVIIQNTKIFQNVKSFYPVVFISFSIVQIFFAAVLSNAIGISMVI
jgi:hypothetical protein